MASSVDPRLRALVAEGVLDDEAAIAVSRALGLDADEAAAGRSPRRALIGEVAGYVGAAFVVVALVLLLATEWDDLGLAGQVGVPALASVATWIVSILLWRGVLGAVLAADTGRRLVGALTAAAAVLTGITLMVWLTRGFTEDYAAWHLSVSAAAAFGLVVLGYRLAPSAVGHLVAAGSAALALTNGAQTAGLEETATAALAGGLLLVLAVSWAEATREGLLAEPVLGQVVSGASAVAGSVVIMVSGEEGTAHRWMGYAVMGCVAAVALLVYVRARSWPALVVGVLLLVILTPTVLSDITDGSLGLWGVMLAAGATLLTLSLSLLLHPPTPTSSTVRDVGRGG